MRQIFNHTSTLRLVFAAATFGFAMTWVAGALAADPTTMMTPTAQAADSLRADYRQQQWKRLAQKTDRDSLIAAVLLGMPNDTDHESIDGHANVEGRLAAGFGQDPLALFSLALACQMQGGSCAHPEYYDALVRIAPDNAVHWLMLANGAAPDAGQLHAAVSAATADSHLSATMGILRAALADQPVLRAQADIDAGQLSLLLRRNAVDLMPLPKFGGAVSLCKTPAASLRNDCIELGRRLIDDRSGAILSRMVGSAIVRRLLKGTPEEVAAKELRRVYVWMSETMQASNLAYQEQLQQDVVDLGEWEASQRAVERMGATRLPPANWMPKNPQTLLLSEERTPAPTK
jgi:hypothetical protein